MNVRKTARLGASSVLALAVAAVITTVGAASTGQANQYSQLLRKVNQQDEVRVIVELTGIAEQRAVLRRVRGAGAEVNVRYELFPLLALTVDRSALVTLAASPEVVRIQENRHYPPTLDTSIPWINADDVLDLGFDGTGQTVAILDTGIDDDHPFFGTRLVSQACYSDMADDGDATTLTLCADGTRNSTANGSADVEGVANCLNGTNNICDHGSHVAGIAAGSSGGGTPAGGVARGANIIAIQVFTRFTTAAQCMPNAAPCVRTWESDQLLGLQRVFDLRNTFTIAAANMSLGGGMNATACDGNALKPTIDALLGAGIATVISSGNNNFQNAVGAPGCISTAITVGATDNADGLYNNSPTAGTNRGPLLDLMAPGVGIQSSEPDDVFGTKTGTSMAAPHVAGAFAVLRDAYPTATIATLLGYLQSTGVPITYPINATTNQTTPRINLLAALQAGNSPPTIAADNATVTVNEGSTATNTGTFSDPEGNPVTLSASRGTVTDTGGGTWSWSFGTNDGPTQSGSVTITATDDKDESGSVVFTLTVDNVPPSVVFNATTDVTIDEGDTASALFDFSDPGWADTYSSVFSWGGFAGTLPGTTLVTTQGPPLDLGTASSSKQYGDDGNFTVEATVTDDDGGVAPTTTRCRSRT